MKCLFQFNVNFGYLDYVPMFLFFLGKAYPKSDVLINYIGEGNHHVNIKNDDLNIYTNRIVIPAERMRPELVMISRWLVYPEYVKTYDFVYQGDIDLLIVKEPIPLWKQHKDFMQRNKICYSNTDKIDPPETRGHRLTGLHCFSPKKYFKKMVPVIEKYKSLLEGSEDFHEQFYNPKLRQNDNQKLLYEMVKESGLPLPPEEPFFEYHGLHLGHGRVPGRWKMLFNTGGKERLYMQEYFKVKNTFGEKFQTILSAASERVRNDIKIMEEGYFA